MKRELANYRVLPKVVQVRKETEVKILPRGAHASFDESVNYRITVIPMEQSRQAHKMSYDVCEATVKSGSLMFTYCFEKEQAYKIRIYKDQDELVCLNMYALEADLYARKPLKGDLHVHTYYSDGREEPAIVAANYRKNGFDFLAMTDHSLWKPSKEAIEFYQDIPTDLNLFYGEEIHVNGGYIHAINFGGSSSVNEYFYQNEEKCVKEVSELAKNIVVNEGVDPLDYARRKWIADEIRKTGGLAVLVHPHWMNEAYNMQDVMCDALFENNTQLYLYVDQRAKGRRIPIVGSSDSHGTEPAVYFTEEYTLVFTADESLNGITAAIKDLYSVAVENYAGEEKRVHGDYRMVKYGLFLTNEYYPEYEELCFEQGRAMKDLVTGDEEALAILNLLKGRTERYYTQFFGK
ncbi:MAG: PHP domain-containing protein [Turicibacter sp.]